jgi:hypothetical protein
MKLTKKQEQEIEDLMWWHKNGRKPTAREKRDFINHTVHGAKVKNKGGISGISLNPLDIAKRLRGITIHELWEKDFGKVGWLGYYNLLQEEDGRPIPKRIKDFIKKEMFRGIDADVIESCYKEVEMGYCFTDEKVV